MRNILLDLDGTLTDSSLGITRCVQYALQQLGRPAPPADELLFCIGPPLLESFTVLLPDGSPDLPREAVRQYRDRFDRIGKFENRVYDDIPEALAGLQDQDCRLFLATSKAEVFARQILHHFELSPFFTAIYGARLDGSLCDKGELIGHILEQERLAPAETLMVGDRKHDMIGAATCRIGSVGVTYGFGSEQELTAHGAHHLVHAPLALPGLIARLRREENGGTAEIPRQ
ncbi:HAD hydrolase-like protein [Desulfoprunum benzoelyticum]|jgi:phosphoglycolate phosphatase|uniref:Phosphoglycolate phosphatase n=1 Tax=Desulfoprunum benzoelyticum TaxID=1506996 RepID=A0A840V5U2_9BACT|nr:HAD hydrolase-like protein [Desulfoprunum benzoelyticum]MBB5349280.1 phosphoglycolate phosphatase [Desulfoprunum benzoelyticum]MBM9530972.1 HAD hydrolase-like protein [Desulfoprunum benzoelyticum]